MQEALRRLEGEQLTKQFASPDAATVTFLELQIKRLTLQLQELTTPLHAVRAASYLEIPEPVCPFQLLQLFRAFRDEVGVKHGQINSEHAVMVVMALQRLCTQAVEGKRLTTDELKEGYGSSTLIHAIKRWNELLVGTPYRLSVESVEGKNTNRANAYQIIER